MGLWMKMCHDESHGRISIALPFTYSEYGW